MQFLTTGELYLVGTAVGGWVFDLLANAGDFPLSEGPRVVLVKAAVWGLPFVKNAVV